MRVTRVVATATVLVAIIAGCGGGSGTKDTNADGFAIKAGASVLTPAVMQVIFRSTGGGHWNAPPAGAACTRGTPWNFSVDLGMGQFSWQLCDVAGTGANAADYVPNSGSRTLPATQLDTVKAAVADVRVSDRDSCGADKDAWSFEVKSATANLVYGDDFYACSTMYQHFVDGADLSTLQSTLTVLAH